MHGSMSNGDVLPALCRTAASVVGSSCTDEVFITTNSIMAFVAVSPHAIDFIARIPYGVAALPSPKKLQDIFIVISVIVDLSSGPKSFVRTGVRNFDKN